jgi:erythromycin esterase
MRHLATIFASLLLVAASACSDATSSTEPIVPTFIGIPPGWFGGSSSAQYTIGLTAESHSGNRAVFIVGDPGVTAFASVAQGLSPDAVRGKRVRWSGWIKTRELTTTDAGLWIRVDGPTGTLAFDNMTWAVAEVRGTNDWKQMSVVVDVPDNALGIALGLLFEGTGIFIADDLAFEEVPTSVALSNPGFTPTVVPNLDSASVAANYVASATAPLNTDFEAGGQPTDASVAWLKSHVTPLTGATAAAPDDELDPFTAMVGSARVVGLGEGTHGTSEFFSLKDRLIRHLVTKMGFTRFGIEATSPESDEVNRYVLGETDTSPVTLIGNLYFWTVDAQEVVDMVDWMREYNAGVAPAQRVQFFGIDMQSPGGSIDSVEAFIARVDPAQSSYVSTRIDCIRPFRNVGNRFTTSRSVYAAKPASEKQVCAGALKEVRDLIAMTDAYRSAEPAHYEAVLHSARLIQQFEEMIALPSAIASSNVRDKGMAENAQWILDQGGPGAKLALWAHNDHVIKTSSAMGGILRQSLGSDYVNVGFAFGIGSFYAVGGAQNLLSVWNVTTIQHGSIEEFFTDAQRPFALFDAHQIAAGGADASQLGQPLLMRSIGSTYIQAQASAFYRSVVLPRDFDVIAWVASAKPSALLR